MIIFKIALNKIIINYLIICNNNFIFINNKKQIQKINCKMDI